MTEEDAVTRTCHRTLAPVHDQLGGVTYGPAPCIASECMAWEWSEPKRSAAFLEAVAARMQAQKKPNFNTAIQEVYAETGGQFARTEGDCGLKARAQ